MAGSFGSSPRSRFTRDDKAKMALVAVPGDKTTSELVRQFGGLGH
jgi:hypothetical protein